MPHQKTKVLVVDDDPNMGDVLQILLDQWEFETKIAVNGAEGTALGESWNPDVVISDVVMPDCSGIELLKNLKKNNPARPVILVTAAVGVDAAVEAMKHGAQDFLTKPLDYDKLRALLDEATRDIELRATARKLSLRLEQGSGFGDFVGTSAAMRTIYDLVESVAACDASAIITGESGTGKEVAARMIHMLSARKHRPFIAINSAAIPETLIESEVLGHEKGAFTGAATTRAGCFEMADTGTLFLDEISEMPIALQPKLLRVLENRKVRRLGGSAEVSFDVRVLAATNCDPHSAINDGKLREDLYYRLNVFTITLPPLRDRRGDIPLLVQHFISEFDRKHQRTVEAVRPETLELLSAYTWPGNIRELRNVIERAVILSKGSWIETGHLPAYFRDGKTNDAKKIVFQVGTSLAQVEKELILRTLKHTDDNKAEAARHLGVDVKTIRNKMKAYGLSGQE